jgi:hypothetical protein
MMKKFMAALSLSLPLEILGVVTLLTNDGIVPSLDLGFSVPVYIISSDIQGFGLFLAGSMTTVIMVLQKTKQR